MTDDVRDPETSFVLNIGSGPRTSRTLAACFRRPGWRELRLDIDPEVDPDVVGSPVDMRPHFADGSLDAIWSSHNLEHLYEHEVPLALGEFRRVLRPDGFAVVTCPDLQAVAESLLAIGLDAKAYDAPIGPIRVHDMIFGHGPSVARGNGFMAHRCGFTQASLGALATAAGFREVRVGRGRAYDLWALLPMPDCAEDRLRDLVRDTPMAFLFPPESA